jgi:predicted glycosyltransferase
LYDIWVDIANTPRVLFFKSLLCDLKKYSIYITTTPLGDTHRLMENFGMKGQVVNGFDGIHSTTITAIFESFKLAYIVPHFKIAMTLEGSRPILTAKMRDKKIINFLDNDIKLSCNSNVQKIETKIKELSDFLIVPRCTFEAFSKVFIRSKIFTYDGYKEHISIMNYSPDKEFFDKIPFREYVVLRPESFESYYVNKDRSLCPELIPLLEKENINVIYLPRDKTDTKISPSKNVFIPHTPLNGLDLCHNAQAVLTGSGTMAREAAVLGTTAISFFTGDNLLLVDQDLVDKKRMFHSRNPEEIVEYLVSNRNTKRQPEFETAKKVRKDVINIITSIVERTYT